MGYGGGSFTTYNKVLPGSYINFVSKNLGSQSFNDRGIATFALELDFFPDDEVVTITKDEFLKNSLEKFGYSYDSEKVKGLRDLFMHADTLLVYRLNSFGKKANSSLATCKYTGVRGNDITIVVSKNSDDLFEVKTLLDNKVVDTQTVANSSELVENSFVVFKNVALSVTAGISLTGGENGVVDTTSHQKYLDKIQNYTFNTMGTLAKDDATCTLYVEFTKSMRDEIGLKFQLCIFDRREDYEGVINVVNRVTDKNEPYNSLVFWVTGLIAGCKVNKSCVNKVYKGSFDVEVNYTQKQLETAIKNGEFVLHKINEDLRVLKDINSLQNTTTEKNYLFKNNQTIRVLDQIASDISAIFNSQYLGLVPNDESGRTSLWSDIVNHHQTLQNIRAIENFDASHVQVVKGDTNEDVIVQSNITIVNAMEKLYMTVIIE